MIYATFILLVATGFAWLAVHFLANDADEMMPLQAWNMKIHGAAAWLVTYLIGTIWAGHIRLAWKLKVNRYAGTCFAIVVGLLSVSGYGLYYFNGEVLRTITEWLHWLAGGLACILFWLHRALGKRLGQVAEHSRH